MPREIALGLTMSLWGGKRYYGCIKEYNQTRIAWQLHVTEKSQRATGISVEILHRWYAPAIDLSAVSFAMITLAVAIMLLMQFLGLWGIKLFGS